MKILTTNRNSSKLKDIRTFNSFDSKGTITDRVWLLNTPSGLEPRIYIGSDPEVTHNFSLSELI